MMIIEPAIITDATLVSSTVSEPAPGEVAWNSTTAYVEDDVVYDPATHMRYRAAAANTGRNPATDVGTPTVPAVWSAYGATNRWAMFDKVVGTSTHGPSPLTVVVRPGSTSGVSVLEIVGRTATISMKDTSGGTVIYSKTIDLDGTIIESFYDWFFAVFEPMTGFNLVDLPGQFPSCELTLTVTNTGADAAVGVFKPGTLEEYGGTSYGASAGILDFSVKDRDKFGRMSVKQGEYSARTSFEVLTEKRSFNRLYRQLVRIRATPCIFIGTEEPGYEPLTVYGYYRDFTFVVSYPTLHLLSIDIEGLI